MKIVTPFVFLAILILFSSCGIFSKTPKDNETTEIKPWFTGSWEGNGYMVVGDGSWKINVNAGDGTSISVKYPNQGCGGTWTTLKTKTKKMEFAENITFGEACVEGSEIELTLIQDDRVELSYYNDLVSRKLVATATMNKIGR